MKFALIGWGSLIWQPKELAIEGEWHEDGPLLPVEFARFSSRDRLTLVIVDGAPLQRTLWALSLNGTLEEARESLRIREQSGLRFMGACLRGSNSVGSVPGSAAVLEWLAGTDLDGAVWTALGSNNPDKSPGLATEEERLGWLRELVTQGKADAAREYIERAPVQIDTPLRCRIREELGWGV